MNACIKTIAARYSLTRQERNAPLDCGNLVRKDPLLHDFNCAFASWLYFEVGQKLVRDYFQNKKVPPCRSWSQHVDKDIAALVIFLEWKVRPHLPGAFARDITTAAQNRNAALKEAQRVLLADAEIVQLYGIPDLSWLKKRKFAHINTYGDHERLSLFCLLSAMEQEAQSLGITIARNPRRGGVLNQEVYARYREETISALNVTPDSALPLSSCFVPPPASVILDSQQHPPTKCSSDYQSLVHDQRHLIIFGESGSGKSALLQYIALRQPVEWAPIWLPAQALGDPRRIQAPTELYAYAIRHIFPGITEDRIEHFIDILHLAFRRIFILDASTQVPRRFLQLLMSLGRVIMTAPIGFNSVSQLPNPKAWAGIELTSWSPARLHALLRRYGDGFPVDTQSITEWIGAGMPATPKWALQMRHVFHEGHPNSAMLVERLVESHKQAHPDPEKYIAVLRKAAWLLHIFSGDVGCSGAKHQLTKKDCARALPWAQKRGWVFMPANADDPIQFLDSAEQCFLAAEYIVTKNQWPAKDRLDPDYSVYPFAVPRLLTGKNNAPQTIQYLFYILEKQQEWALLNAFFDAFVSFYEDPDASPLSLSQLNEFTHAVGPLRRRLLFEHGVLDEGGCIGESNVNCKVLKKAYEWILLGVEKQLQDILPLPPSAVSSETKTILGTILTALEPLPEGTAADIAQIIWQYSAWLKDDKIVFLLTPRIKHALDALFTKKCEHEARHDSVRWRDRLLLLARRQVLSAKTIEALLPAVADPSSNGYVDALSLRGDLEAAHELVSGWKSPVFKLDISHFDRVLSAWTGSTLDLFEILRAVYYHFRVLHDPAWRIYLEHFIQYLNAFSELFFPTVELASLPEPFSHQWLSEIGRQELCQPAVVFALAGALSQHAQTDDNQENALGSSISKLREVLYKGTVDDSLLFLSLAEDALFLFQYQMLPPRDMVQAAYYALSPRLPDERIENWAKYIISQKIHGSDLPLGKLGSAIILAPCESVYTEFMEDLEYEESDVLAYAIGIKRKLCASSPWQ